MHLQRRVAKQAGKLRFRDDLRRHKVQDKNFQRADVLRNRAGLRHDEDILTLQGSSCRQIVRYLNGHGVPSGLFGGKRLIEIGNQVVRILKAAGQPHKVGRNAAAASSLSFIWRCVVLAGCRQHVRASATCVSMEASFRWLINRSAAALPPLTPNEMTPQEPFGRYFCASS